MIRSLNPTFINALKDKAQLFPLLERVQKDRDLVLEIREDYFNIYFKGHNVMKVEYDNGNYQITFNIDFTVGLQLPNQLNHWQNVITLLNNIPNIKDQISLHSNDGQEIEFEQLLIRANNYESRINSDYFFIDRQVVTKDKKGRFDLVGFYWPTKKRKQGQIVDLVLAEVKYGLNNDIQKLPSQLLKYTNSVVADMPRLTDEAQYILNQKIDLGLLGSAHNNGNVLKSLKISDDFTRIHFLIILVDYNPHSKLLARALTQLPPNVEIFKTGFGLWK